MMTSTDQILRRPGRLLHRKEDIKFLMIILEVCFRARLRFIYLYLYLLKCLYIYLVESSVIATHLSARIALSSQYCETCFWIAFMFEQRATPLSGQLVWEVCMVVSRLMCLLESSVWPWCKRQDEDDNFIRERSLLENVIPIKTILVTWTRV